MTPRIEILAEKKLVGKKMRMSLANNMTGVLWKSFMQARKNITNQTGTELYSVQEYDSSYFTRFSPHNEFEKCAAVEVTDFNTIPAGMEPIILPGGRYAVFIHKGAAATGAQTFKYILTEWLPASGYVLDDRLHFEVLGEKYRNDDPDSEEEIWIPVRSADF